MIYLPEAMFAMCRSSTKVFQYFIAMEVHEGTLIVTSTSALGAPASAQWFTTTHWSVVLAAKGGVFSERG